MNKDDFVIELPDFEFDKDRLIDIMNSDLLGDWRELTHFPMKGESNEFHLGLGLTENNNEWDNLSFMQMGVGYLLKEFRTEQIEHIQHLYDRVNPNILLWAQLALRPANFLKYPPYMKLAKHKDRLRTGSIHFPLGDGEPTKFYDDDFNLIYEHEHNGNPVIMHTHKWFHSVENKQNERYCFQITLKHPWEILHEWNANGKLLRS